MKGEGEATLGSPTILMLLLGCCTYMLYTAAERALPSAGRKTQELVR